MMVGENKKLTPSKRVAYTAVMCALLIGGQLALSAVSGVEIVTVLMVCFCCVSGVRTGAVCAVAFTLLRCFLFGFHPTAFILYLIYFPSLALVFGGMGHIKKQVYESCPPLLTAVVCTALILIAGASLFCNLSGVIKISAVYKNFVNVLLWIIFAISVALCAAFCVLTVLKKKGANTAGLIEIITVTAAACLCTVCFTLLDDIISPLFYGWSKQTALTYFYASFLAMLPQTVCTAVTVSTMYLPLTSVMKKAVSL